MFGVADVVARVSDAAFGRPLVTNVLRGHVVEAIVALALEPEWRWCAADYASWDFEHDAGVRLEVRQSALRQSWVQSSTSVSRPAFDIRARTGRTEAGQWIAEPGRAANLYLFCYHDRTDDDADHRDPRQWSFFIVPAASLPDAGTIGLASLRRYAAGVPITALRAAMNDAVNALTSAG
ncbi:hypothetical protein [Sphingomonas sp. CFBP 8760]|uniref:hypothetical protein n=1 Tax=Sphingomonas sp. CFBP 8760 TaxID=2775282 RepID=UPI00178031C6|nr:hypothetical protein [Sphingomonas sp. CFBP 8760]MBD8547781.1 hypothetical protein [Sphingomonas sp. CFBP 8760]